eukprot:gb/GEZN01010160.1/.p1 GENE.gb/GEZN01010160.1/~~gb/GEZN01010160.1/.p1  ORF type:complete len:392 (+),score=54.81 gb/GEZN01010160.1/:52-1176(+)
MLSLLFSAASINAQQAWDYNNINWGLGFPLCNGAFQTPININERDAVYHSGLIGIDWDNTMVRNTSITVSSSVTLKFTDLQPQGVADVLIKGGPAAHAYRLEQIHMHWAQTDNAEGTEHAFNGKTYALEAHMVHHREDLGSVGRAATTAHGLLVVGVLFDITMDNSQGNAGLQSIIEAFQKGDTSITPRNTSFTAPLNVRDVMPDDFPARYYSYQGSLTTPPCFESVTWVLAATKGKISMPQLQAFRALSLNGKPVGPNYRPLQLQKYRTVFKSFNDDDDESDVSIQSDVAAKPMLSADGAPSLATTSHITSEGTSQAMQSGIIAALVLSAGAMTMFVVLLVIFCKNSAAFKADVSHPSVQAELQDSDFTANSA